MTRRGAHRVVVVGHGMVAARFVDDLLARDPQGRCTVTVLGAEPEGGYNRVLLSEVVAGRANPAALSLADPSRLAAGGVAVHPATTAVGIDRAARAVHCDDGVVHGYDTLVLATGARPWLPRLERLGDGHCLDALPDGVHPFRTLADCRRVVAAATSARTAVVLGGGALGVEVARGLAGRGLQVALVHAGRHLLERHLDSAAAGVFTAAVRRCGIDVRLGSRGATALEVRHGRVCAVVDGGVRLPADLVVLACGVRPDTAFAATAGLTGPTGGVMVDDRMRSVRDASVAAIGDCAEHRGRVGGLLAPGWEQARVLADLVTGADTTARYHGTTPLLRLTAAELDVLAVGSPTDLAGDPLQPPVGAEVVQLTDPGRGVYVKVVLRDGVVAAATVVGAARTAAELLLLADRGTLAPTGRDVLLFPGSWSDDARATKDHPTTAAEDTTVCRCNGVSAAELRVAWWAGARTVEDLASRTRATTGCGDCRSRVARLADQLVMTAAAS